QGIGDLKKAIGGKYAFPEKLVMTGEQREENKDCLKDILTGAFCIQELDDVTFVVKNERGDTLPEYYKSIYDDIGDGVRL
ncbi:MAG: hypothetical protein PH343_09975, partial [Nitrospira sp.]|nr:hypothetical protein [Nitrospira sp.]